MKADTIAALATPLGEGGLAIIRVSGAEAVTKVGRCFVAAGKAAVPLSQAASHTLHYGHILRESRVVDEVLVSVMRAPRTYTREDVTEISCHGGLVVARAVLESVLATGVRLAEPGEFTLRAFLNGRLDLAQAEAVADIVHARTDLALQVAQEQLAGGLSRRIDQLRDGLMNVLAHVEAHLDFPDEDIAPATRAAMVRQLREAEGFTGRLLATAPEGQVLRQGIRAAIVGRPNVGKSSVLNQLLGQDRAIVSAQAGTTRDTVEETANVRGIPVVLVDTAGLRETNDHIEQEGVRRTHRSADRAELILHVLDASQPLQDEDTRLLELWGDRQRILVRNKIDLDDRLRLPKPILAKAVNVSALSGEGMDTLRDRIRDLVLGGEIRPEMLEVMISTRHGDALARAQLALRQAIEALEQDRSLEFVAVDLRDSVQAVGEVVGKTATEDLLDRIFGQFCIGK